MKRFRWYAKEKMMSEVQLVSLILVYKHGVNFTASMIIVFKLTIFNYNLFCVSQPPDTFKKVANCVSYKIKLKQNNFERNAEKILSFENVFIATTRH
jgi:hypothetical protein